MRGAQRGFIALWLAWTLLLSPNCGSSVGESLARPSQRPARRLAAQHEQKAGTAAYGPLTALTHQPQEQQEEQVLLLPHRQLPHSGMPVLHSRRGPTGGISVLHTTRVLLEYPSIVSRQQPHSMYRMLLDGAASGTDNSSTSSGGNSSSAGSLPADITALPGTDGGGAAAGASNPWFDQQVLGGAAGGSSGLLYLRLNSSASAGMAALDDLAALNQQQEQQQQQQQQQQQVFLPDPPPYDYPPVGRHVSVFFTAVLQGWSNPSGLAPADQLAWSAAVNTFLAPAPDVVVSNTTIITQALASSGLWLPCVTALLGNDATLQDFLASTLQGDPNLVFPTASWGSVRTLNIKLAVPATPASVTHAWAVGDYGNCSALCGGGQQRRAVSCLDSLGNTVAWSACPQPPPASNRSCQTQPCQASLPSGFSLVLGEWGPCNSTCGLASRTRSAMCVSREGYVGSLTSCYATLEELAYQLWQACTLPACPSFIWSYSDWSCNNTAGCGGTATRKASCVASDTNKPVDSSRCSLAALDNTTQPCAMSPCNVYYWRT